MKDMKAIKRITIGYGVLIGLFAFLVAYVPQLCVSAASTEVQQVAEQEEQRMVQAQVEANTLSGDVLDCNGIPVYWVDPETGESCYRDEYAYSNVLGVQGENTNQLLERQRQLLKTPSGGTDKGDNLLLTLNSEIQENIYRILSAGEGERSSAVVLDAETGAIVALVNYPSYDATAYTEEMADTIPAAVRLPLLYPYRPGSCFKPLIGVGIKEQGLDRVMDPLPDPGYWEVPTGGVIYDNGVNKDNAEGRTVHQRTFETAIEYSSNVYFARMAYELGWDKVNDLMNRFRVGEQSMSFDFGTMNSTFESALEPYDRSKSNIQLAKIGYGYSSIQLTTLHAAMICQALANEGIMCTPYMVDEVHPTVGIHLGDGTYTHEYGEAVENPAVACWQKGKETVVTEASVAEEIVEAMKAGYRHTLSAYSGPASAISDLNEQGITVNGVTYSLAMKTGTADLDEGKTNNAWIVSCAPAENPKYVVVVSRYRVPDKTYGNSLLADVAAIYRMLLSEQ